MIACLFAFRKLVHMAGAIPHIFRDKRQRNRDVENRKSTSEDGEGVGAERGGRKERERERKGYGEAGFGTLA